MTREDFIRGWMLLTAQPWGKSYRSMHISEGEPTPAEIQAEFYFKALAFTPATLWWTACETYAKGEHWPSVDALRQTLKELTPPPKVLPAPVEYCSMEEALVDQPDLRAKLAALRQV